MSTAAAAASGGLGRETRLSLAHVIQSEWTKLWSLRSTRWTLLVAFLAQAGIGPLVAAITMANWSQMSPVERLTIHPIDRSLFGWIFAQLAIGVLGVMTISGEYTTGSIRSTMLAVPKRLPVLWAKLAVFAAIAFVLMLIAALIGFFSSQALFSEHHVNVALSAPNALRAVIGAALLTTVTGAMCVGIGAIVRRTAAGISLFVFIFFVLPGLVQIFPASTANAINPFLPSSAADTVTLTEHHAHTFSPWGGLALFCGYTVAVIVIAGSFLRRRDA